jgi:hypothetical protein
VHGAEHPVGVRVQLAAVRFHDPRERVLVAAAGRVEQLRRWSPSS